MQNIEAGIEVGKLTLKNADKIPEEDHPNIEALY